jgi:hypothetical protein
MRGEYNGYRVLGSHRLLLGSVPCVVCDCLKAEDSRADGRLVHAF